MRFTLDFFLYYYWANYCIVKFWQAAVFRKGLIKNKNNFHFRKLSQSSALLSTCFFKCVLANPRRLVYGYQFVQNVVLDRLTSFNKRQKWTSSFLNFVIYGNFHMFYFGTHTFSLIVFAFVKCIFCFQFLWVWKGTGNKACSFKKYICWYFELFIIISHFFLIWGNF